MSVWSAKISSRWLLLGAALGLLTSGAAAGWLWLPTPDDLIAGMWTTRAALYRDLKEERAADALRGVREWRRQAQLMPKILWLRRVETPEAAPERLAALDKNLAQLEAALVDKKADLLPALAGRCFEAHRAWAALFDRQPAAISAAPEPDPGHQHGKREVAPDEPVPRLSLEVVPDPKSGWNLHLVVENFRFSPLNASRMDVPGEGHAHLFVDGKKITRLYGDWYYIGKLGPGRHIVRVTLNTNDHNDLTANGEVIAAETEIAVNDGTEFVYFQTSTDLADFPELPDDELCRDKNGKPAGAPAGP